MLSDLYAVRKSGNTDSEKREMAKTFKRVLDKNPSLKKDENLVYLFLVFVFLIFFMVFYLQEKIKDMEISPLPFNN